MIANALSLYRAPRRTQVVGLSAFAFAAMLAALAWPANTQAQPHEFNSGHYRVHARIDQRLAEELARHADVTHQLLTARFRTLAKDPAGRMNLYLLGDRNDYQRFLVKRGLAASHSGGLFFVQPTGRGLTVWTDGLSRSQIISTLQHEAFHQFAYAHLPADTPAWLNEGAAQYFEDAIFYTPGGKPRWHMGLVPTDRLAQARLTLEPRQAMPLAELISISRQRWTQTLATNPHKAHLLYAQAWSVMHFLIHRHDGKHAPALERLLKRRSLAMTLPELARQFGMSEATFEHRWRQYVHSLSTDPVSTTSHRMRVLAHGLAFLHERGEQAPARINALADRLRAYKFRITLSLGSVETQYAASDPRFFTFPDNNGRVRQFELLEPTQSNQPARISARGLRPEPTLIWETRADGTLTSDVRWR